jgi:hypothetical protein
MNMQTKEMAAEVNSALAQLEDKRMDMRERLPRAENSLRAFYFFGIITLTAAIVIAVGHKSFGFDTTYSYIGLGMLVLYALVFLSYALRTRARVSEFKQELDEIDFQIDLTRFPVSEQEFRAEKTLRLHNIQLRRYYDLNLSQNVWVFMLGIFCIIIGAGTIGITIYAVLHIEEQTSKILISALGAIGSILSNYIAAIYLKMHSAASANLGRFHSRLVDTHQVLFGNLVASRIEDDAIRWKTLSTVAINVSSPQRQETSESATSEPRKGRSASKRNFG